MLESDADEQLLINIHFNTKVGEAGACLAAQCAGGAVGRLQLPTARRDPVHSPGALPQRPSSPPSQVKLSSIVIKGPAEAGPKTVKLFVNRTSMGFSDVDSVPCAQVCACVLSCERSCMIELGTALAALAALCPYLPCSPQPPTRCWTWARRSWRASRCR